MDTFSQPLRGVSSLDIFLWGVITLVALAIIVVAVRAEGRFFRRLGLGSAWLKVRVATLPILAITIAAVLGMDISGISSVAAMYLSLGAVAGLVLFGLHGFLGYRLGLTHGQSAWIAGSGLLMIAIIPALAVFLLPSLQGTARSWQGTGAAEATATVVAPSPYTVLASRKLTLPNQEEVWAIHYRAPEGTLLVRVDMQTGDYRAKDLLRQETTALCRLDQDLHVMWPADRPLPVLHVLWKDPAGREAQSSWTPQVPEPAAQPFAIAWEMATLRATLRLPIAVSRSALSFVWERQDRPPRIGELQESSPGDDCAPLEIALPERPALGRPDGLRIRVDHALPKGPTWADFRRPETTRN